MEKKGEWGKMEERKGRVGWDGGEERRGMGWRREKGEWDGIEKRE